MTKWLGDIRAAAILDFKFTTVNTSGVPTTLSGTPVVSVYKDNSTTESTSGVTLSVDFDSRTGLNNVRIDTSADGTFYAAGSNFQVVITTGTVGGSSVVGYVVAEFSIANRSALMPTVAGRTFDVSAGGEGGIDWANIGSPTTTVDLSGTTIDEWTSDEREQIRYRLQLDGTQTAPLTNQGSQLPVSAVVSSLNLHVIEQFFTDDTGLTFDFSSSGSIVYEIVAAVLAAVAALNDFDPTAGGVIVGSLTQAALAQFATDDTGEATAVEGSVAELSQGGAGGGDGATAAEVWAYGTRTLTQGAASVLAAVSGSNITVYRGTTWSITLTGLGSIAAYENIYFSVKTDENDSDDDAILRVDLSGLERVAGAAPDDADNGIITVDDDTAGDITITVEEEETQNVSPAAGLYYDIKGVDTTGDVVMLAYGEGKFTIKGDITRAIV